MATASPQEISRTAVFFEHTWEISEDEYLRLFPVPVTHSRRSYAAITVFAAVALLMFLWPYSAGVGLVLLVVLVFVWRAPSLFAALTRERFRKHQYLHGPVVYGVSHTGVWLRGAHFHAEADWDALSQWKDDGEWLQLYTWGLPAVYLPVEALKACGMYEPVRAIARQYSSRS
jgi:hypothetical protein